MTNPSRTIPLNTPLELPTDEELAKWNMDDLTQLQDILARQIGVFKRIARGDWSETTKRLAKEDLDLTEKEYWDLENKIDSARRSAKP